MKKKLGKSRLWDIQQENWCQIFKILNAMTETNDGDGVTSLKDR